MNEKHSLLIGFVALVLGVTTLAGCSKKYVRGTDEPGIDYRAMSLRFDKRDINHLYNQVSSKLMESSIVREWEFRAKESESPLVAIFPFKNETSEHISSQLETLLSKFETDLVNKTAANVVSRERQRELISEIKQKQESDAYDASSLASYGQQLGAHYFLTGKVRDVAERVDGERRVQYILFVQVLEVETGSIKFQSEATVTKALQ